MKRSKNSLNPRKAHRGPKERRWKRRKGPVVHHTVTPSGVPRGKKRREEQRPSATYKWRP